MENTRAVDSMDRELLLGLSMTASTCWEILVASDNAALSQKVADIFAQDNRITVSGAKGGGHAIIKSARTSPDLLIIDDISREFPPKSVISLLKEDTSLKGMFVLCGISSYASDDVPDWGADDYFSLKNLDSVHLKRKITSLIFLSERGGLATADAFQPHERMLPRTKLNLTATLEMISLEGPPKSEVGEALVEDISASGALLSGIRFKNAGIPLEPYHIRLKINDPSFKDWTADSVVVRMKDYGSAGVKFLDISQKDRKKIEDYIPK